MFFGCTVFISLKGGMNVLVFISTLLLGNTTNKISLQIEQTDYEQTQLLEQRWRQNPEKLMFDEQWKQYKINYGKYYNTVKEEYRRKKIFIQNSLLIKDHNRQYNEGLSTFELGHNQFSDLTHKEFLERYTALDKSLLKPTPTVRDDPTVGDDPTVRDDPTGRYDPIVRYYHEPTVRYENDGSVEENRENSLSNGFVDYIPPAHDVLPLFVDWRKDGAVTPVKDQGKCKAHWLFSATGALEGQVFRKTKKLVSLSEQNILDCAKKFNYKGCHNGSVYDSLQYVIRNKGIDANAIYPWYGKQCWLCHYKRGPNITVARGVTLVTSGDERALQTAVAYVGPTSVSVDASSETFQFYKTGIYNDLNCTTTNLNYNLLVVGYSQLYYIAKNSLGENWGNAGYIYMSKGKGNQCGIATRAMYPII